MKNALILIILCFGMFAKAQSTYLGNTDPAVTALVPFIEKGTPWIKETGPSIPNKIYRFSLPVKKWVAPTVKGVAYLGAFAGGICSGKGEWELTENGWPRSTTSHLWRDAGNWTTGGSCMLLGIGVMLNGTTDWKECLWNGLAIGASNWLGTRIGYYKMRKL